MPWFESKQIGGQWGWHWSMGKLDPDNVENGRREAASHYRPLIGLYDSSDVQALECHVLLMKFAGIGGVMVDWYGTKSQYDYSEINRNTQRLFDVIRRAGLKFSLVYEDQSVPQLIKGGKIAADQAVESGRDLMRWVDKTWFRSPSYLRLNGQPVFLVFGPQYYKPGDWDRMFEGLSPKPAFFSLHNLRPPAIGAYDWPLPQRGTEGSAKWRAGFYERAKSWPAFIPSAYPRFNDFYKEAGIHDSYGLVDDLSGKTYAQTLTDALESPAKIVQIATWNDWGEGTQIEPSEEFGYRDLETTQRLSRKFLGSLRYSASNLRLPVKLYLLQKKYAGNAAMQSFLVRISKLLFAGKTDAAGRAMMKR